MWLGYTDLVQFSLNLGTIYFHLISTLRNLSKLLRAQEFQGSGVATPLEWLLEKLKAFSQLLVILGSYFLEN